VAPPRSAARSATYLARARRRRTRLGPGRAASLSRLPVRSLVPAAKHMPYSGGGWVRARARHSGGPPAGHHARARRVNSCPAGRLDTREVSERRREGTLSQTHTHTLAHSLERAAATRTGPTRSAGPTTRIEMNPAADNEKVRTRRSAGRPKLATTTTTTTHTNSDRDNHSTATAPPFAPLSFKQTKAPAPSGSLTLALSSELPARTESGASWRRACRIDREPAGPVWRELRSSCASEPFKASNEKWKR
jgi:hypothetical protein